MFALERLKRRKVYYIFTQTVRLNFNRYNKEMRDEKINVFDICFGNDFINRFCR
jgi:hypothetical protein